MFYQISRLTLWDQTPAAHNDNLLVTALCLGVWFFFYFLSHFSSSLTCASWDYLLNKLFSPKSLSLGLLLGEQREIRKLARSVLLTPCPKYLRHHEADTCKAEVCQLKRKHAQPKNLFLWQTA